MVEKQPVVSVERPMATQRTRERRRRRITVVEQGVWSRPDSLSPTLDARTSLEGAARAEGYLEVRMLPGEISFK